MNAGSTTSEVRRSRPGRSPRLSAAIFLSLVIGLGAVLSVRSNILLRHDRERVEHSFQVMRTADQILIGLIDAETGQRGFLISEDPGFLLPYEQAISKTIPQALQELSALVADTPDQSARVRELRSLAGLKLQELGATLSVQKEQGPEAARDLLANLQGKDVMDHIRDLKESLQQREQALLAERSIEVRRDEQRIILTIVVMTTVSTIMRLVFAAWRQHDSARPGASVD